MRPSATTEYPTPGWVSFQSATRVSFALAATTFWIIDLAKASTVKVGSSSVFRIASISTAHSDGAGADERFIASFDLLAVNLKDAP
jgi:hypothetical protein